MDVPIRINGEVTGKLEIMPEGNYTLFLGRCADPGRLLRLSVYGGGREGYIGVMMPEGGTVTVKKRFTRYDLRAFPATIEEQTRQSLTNCKAVLEAAGAAMENVIKTTVFLSDMNNFAAMNGVYATFFEGACPARSAVEVARLPKDALVEIECIAVL